MIAAETRVRSMIARLAAFARGVYRDDLRLQWAALAFLLIFYGPFLWHLWSRDRNSLLLTFNSMFAHLLRGRFDVDPQIVGFEGFVRDGRTYAYWGVWCALLRLPLWIVGRMDVDMTVWSCLAAVCVAGLTKVRAVLLLRRHGREGAIAAWAIGLMLAFVLLGRCEAYLAAASVYQEVALWAYAFAALFVYLALKGVVNRWFDLRTLSWMALFAGLALLTRVSTGIGLLLAMVLLLLVLAVQSGTSEEGQRWQRMRRFLIQPRMLVPLAILAALVAATGAVNYFRWGNPTTFANYDLYLPLKGDHAGGLLPLHRFGLFNVRRIPFGLIYFFLPIWVLRASNGHLVFEHTLAQMYWLAEGPPSSFFLTDLLPMCFIFLLVIALWRRRAGGLRSAGQWAAAIAVGLLAPCILMLTAIYLAYRYRADFFPEIDFLAFLGLYMTVTDVTMLAMFARYRRWMIAALSVGLAGSLLLLLIPHASGLHLHFLEALQRFCDPLESP